MIQLRIVLLAATLCFLLGVFALSGQAACHSVACRRNQGSTPKSSSRGSRFQIVKTPFIHRRADAKPTSLEVASDTTGEAPSTSFPSTELATSLPEVPSTTSIRSSQNPSVRETGNPPSSTASSSLLSSVSTSPTNEDSSSGMLTSVADSTLTEDFSSISPASLPNLRATANPSSLEQIITSDSSSIVFDAAGSFSTDTDIPRTTYNATSNDDDGNSNEKLHEVMPFIVVLVVMVAIGLCTGIRCALRGRQRRRRQYDAESRKSLHSSSRMEEKNGESYGWVDGHTTSRRMWSMMASRKGIKQKVTRPLGRRRAISESSIPRQSVGTPFLSPPVMSYVDVGFGIMITDEPEQQGSSDPEQRTNGQVGLPMSKSSPDIRKKPSRRVTGDYLVHTPSRPSPLRHSYLTP